MGKTAAITVMKNESDILPFKLKYMEDKVDYYLFLDNESTDNSVELVSKHPKTVFCDTVKGIYNTKMKDLLIEVAQKFIGEEDWIVQIDCDEFPFFNIKDTVNKVSEEFNCLRIHFPYYFFTREMYHLWKEDESYRDRLRHFNIQNYHYFANTIHSEIRIVKNIKQSGERLRLTRFKLSMPLPDYPNIFDDQLFFGHYQYRNPEQIAQRLETRRQAIEGGSPSFHYYTEKWGLNDWNYKKLFVPEKKLLKFDYNRPFSLDRTKLKKMNKLFYILFNPRKSIIAHIKYLFK